jgi:protein TonB
MMADSTTVWRFFALSLATHALVVLMIYPLRAGAIRAQPETIPVSVLPPSETAESAPIRTPRTPPTRMSRAPSVVAKKDSRVASKNPASSRARVPVGSELTPPPSEKTAESPRPSAPPEQVPQETVIAERELPTLKELLPSATWSSSSARTDTPISLNTTDPVYVTYFTKIKQLIESHWEYPEIALRYGLQGRLALQFMIGANGQLEQLRLVRSSGSQVLDEEAARAIRAAAPFPPIPSWIKPNPLLISASMEYHDNRLNYRFAR